MLRMLIDRFRALLDLVLTLIPCAVMLVLLADDPPADKRGGKPADIAPPTAEELADRRMVFMKAALARYTVEVGGRKEVARVADPCLRWTNPIGTATDGVVA